MDRYNLEELIAALTEPVYPLNIDELDELDEIGQLTAQGIVDEAFRLFQIDDEEAELPDERIDVVEVQAVLDMWSHPQRDAAWHIYTALDTELSVGDRINGALEILNSENPVAGLRAKMVTSQEVRDGGDGWLWSQRTSWFDVPGAWEQMQADTCDKLAALV